MNDIRDVLAKTVPASSPRTAARRAQTALIVSALLALLLLGWNTWDRVHSRLEREQALAAQVTDSAAEKLIERLKSFNRQLVGFVDRERALLEALIAMPEVAATRDDLWAQLQRHFPPAAAALVLDAQGTWALELGEPIYGEEDAGFFRHFSGGEVPTPRFAHRDGSLYADLAASWVREGALAGALLLRLSCHAVCSPAAMPAPAGHSLRLAPDPSLTPIADASPKDTSRLGATLAEVPLGETGWMLIDRLDAQYASGLVFNRLAFGFGLGAAFLLAVLALYHWAGSQGRGVPQERISLRECRLKLQAILSATTDGIILTDLGGRIELFNPIAEMMFASLSEDVHDTNVSKLLPDFFSSRSAIALLRQEDSMRATPVVYETQGQRKGDRSFPVRLWVRSVHFDEKRRLLIVVQDLSENERNEKQLVFLEQRDVLTGLLNRREFERRLTAVLADPQHSPESPHVVCHIDVDQFKLVNDTCGHEAGDQLLKQLAILIDAKLVSAELIGRFGGDEFVVLFKNRSAEEVRDICDGLTQTVRNFLFTWSDQSFDVAISMGLAEFAPRRESPSSALSKADVACHMAKAHGRARIHIYHEGDLELVRHHGDMHLVSAISQALSDGRFHLYAQPIVHLAVEGSRRHFEILVRMVDENGASIIPDQFIPAAERYILMPAVDRWIVNRLFSTQAENLRAWHQVEPECFLFAVNLSGTSITDEGFLPYLKRLFTEWDVPYGSICFEITETAAVSDLEHARAFMQELSALGCSFALDDFGTGLSSYSYLKELPVDYLKIDGSFVRGMCEDPVNRALVESISQIGHVLGLQTIAEWAEDGNTLIQLRELNVDFAQGFGIGEPLPLSALTQADLAIPFPSSLEDTPDDRLRGPHGPRRGTARPT